MALRSAGVLLVALLTPAITAGEPLYKLVDRNGHVTFTDTPPKVFDGRVIRLEPVDMPSFAPPQLAPPGGRAAEPAGEPPVGFYERRQRAQAALLARLDEARRDVEEARRAREEGKAARPDEMQVIQRRYPFPRAEQPAPFANCASRTDPASGAPVLICPTQVPGPAYHERQRKLEAAAVEAESVLAEAERAYRRGTE